MERKRIKFGFNEFRFYFSKYFDKLDQNQKNVLLGTKKQVDNDPWDYSFQV
jgi:hypothetical protein